MQDCPGASLPFRKLPACLFIWAGDARGRGAKAGATKRNLVALICRSHRGLRSGPAAGRKLPRLMLAFSSLMGLPLIRLPLIGLPLNRLPLIDLTLIPLPLMGLPLIGLPLIELPLICWLPASAAAADVQRCSPGAKLPAPGPSG